MPHGNKNANKVYMVLFDRVTKPLLFAFGLCNEGFDLRPKDLIQDTPKKPERVLICFQSRLF